MQPQHEGQGDAEKQMQPRRHRARQFTAQVVKAITGERECDREASERCTEQTIAIDRPGNTNVDRGVVCGLFVLAKPRSASHFYQQALTFIF